MKFGKTIWQKIGQIGQNNWVKNFGEKLGQKTWPNILGKKMGKKLGQNLGELGKKVCPLFVEDMYGLIVILMHFMNSRIS